MYIEYKYFISYIHVNEPRFGTGNACVITKKAITTLEQLQEISKDITEIRPDYQNVVVLNYQLLCRKFRLW